MNKARTKGPFIVKNEDNLRKRGLPPIYDDWEEC